MTDIVSAGKTAVSAAATQAKTFVVPFVIGIFVVTLIVGFVPGLKKFLV